MEFLCRGQHCSAPKRYTGSDIYENAQSPQQLYDLDIMLRSDDESSDKSNTSDDSDCDDKDGKDATDVGTTKTDNETIVPKSHVHIWSSEPKITTPEMEKKRKITTKLVVGTLTPLWSKNVWPGLPF